MTKVLSALLGTIVGGFITWIVNVYQNKSQTTFDFHREFDSSDIHISRIVANQLIKDNSDMLLHEITEKYPEESFHIWRVIKFYRRLWIAIKYNQVKTKLIPDLFGEIFTGWYLICFEKMYIPSYKYKDSQGCKEIVALKMWIDKHADKSKLHQWKQHVLNDW